MECDTCPDETLFIGVSNKQTRNPLLANGRKFGSWIGAIEGSLTQEKNTRSKCQIRRTVAKVMVNLLRGTKKVRERARDSAISRRAETAAHARERDVDRPRVQCPRSEEGKPEGVRGTCSADASSRSSRVVSPGMNSNDNTARRFCRKWTIAAVPPLRVDRGTTRVALAARHDSRVTTESAKRTN